ncbi:MAG: hypothetical protein KAS72_07530 [Phycisphaerales bacterium]|nr:hypothetical protein [Phycisphaerales bacterium]
MFDRRASEKLGLLGLATTLLATSVGLGSTALVPIDPPLITIDAVSPTVAQGVVSSADVLATPPLTVEIPYLALGLQEQDDLDSIAVGPGPVDGDTYALLFSVDRGVFTGHPPDADLWLLGYYYNAYQQAGLGQAAGDMNMSTDLYTNDGIVPGLRGRAVSNNVTVRDGGDAGGTDFALLPGPPMTIDDPNAGSEDNVNGLGGSSGSALRGGENLYFSLTRSSPSLPLLVGVGGSNSGADIYTNGPDTAGNTLIFANSYELGLVPMDEITSSLVLRGLAKGPTGHMFGPGDRVIFSLDPDSPTLNLLEFNSSDLLVVGYGWPIELFTGGDDIGLGNDAVISALTYYLTDDIQSAILDHGIRSDCIPADLNCDGYVDQSDLGILLAAYEANDSGDINGDGATDQADLGILLSFYGYGT